MQQTDRDGRSGESPLSGGYAAEAGHYYLCNRCGQYVDRRVPEQVRHHQRLSHRALTQE
jgi:hypothetical protein